jgi:hypothetical protein
VPFHILILATVTGFRTWRRRNKLKKKKSLPTCREKGALKILLECCYNISAAAAAASVAELWCKTVALQLSYRYLIVHSSL